MHRHGGVVLLQVRTSRSAVAFGARLRRETDLRRPALNCSRVGARRNRKGVATGDDQLGSLGLGREASGLEGLELGLAGLCSSVDLIGDLLKLAASLRSDAIGTGRLAGALNLSRSA